MKMCCNYSVMILLLMMIFSTYTTIDGVLSDVPADPKFSAPILNVTVPVGREALLTCMVEDLGGYKVAWLRVDTQTILTIQNHVITKNHRVNIVHSEHKTWQLKIKDIRESDRGWYMCQINTDPMKSQMGYMNVVVPPDILDYPTSTDMVVTEGSNVTLRCAATGSPEPNITWKRESNDPISLPGGIDVPSVDGPTFTISRVNRLHMGAFLCIASNGVPPSVSKRVMLIVHFPPMIYVQNQLVGAYEGQRISLHCDTEAYPKSINYWTYEKGDIVPQGGKFESVLNDSVYKVDMVLNIKSVGPADFGSYKCVAKNSLGETDGTIKLYKIPPNTINSIDTQEKRFRGKARKGSNNYDSNDIVDDDLENVKIKEMRGEHNGEGIKISSSMAINVCSLSMKYISAFSLVILLVVWPTASL